MPELPEVEIARRSLERWLVGRPIARASATPGKPLRGLTPAEVSRALSGRTVRRVERRGKHLLWDLGAGQGAHLHLGMTGKLVRREGKEPAPPYARVSLDLSDGSRVHLVDPRRFGRFELGPLDALRASPTLRELGPDAWDEAPTAELLRERLAGSRREIKVSLLDQRRIAGLGNIQASESLFRARLSPFARADELSPADWRRLAKGIHDALSYALGAEGKGARDRDIRYVEEPGAPNPFLVYGRAGEPCPRCGGPIRQEVQRQRSTYLCPVCQPGPAPGKR